MQTSVSFLFCLFFFVPMIDRAPFSLLGWGLELSRTNSRKREIDKRRFQNCGRIKNRQGNSMVILTCMCKNASIPLHGVFFWHNIFLLVFKKKNNNKSYQHQRFLLGGLSLYGHCRCANIFFTLSKKKTKKTLQTGEYKYIFLLHTTHIYTNITPLCHVWSNNENVTISHTESIHIKRAHGRLEWVCTAKRRRK